MSIASNISRGSVSAWQPGLNGFVLVESVIGDEAYMTADVANDKTTDCRLGKAVLGICRAAVDLAHTLQSREVTAAHLIMAILANEGARSELQTMGVSNESARAACYAQIGAQTAAGSGANGLQPSAEDAMRNLLRRAMERARKRYDPELHVVGVSDLCVALMDLSKDELRIRMLLQGTRSRSAPEVAVGIVLLVTAALAAWYAIGSSGGWSTAFSWLGGMLT
jgi:hypothetical protein